MATNGTTTAKKTAKIMVTAGTRECWIFIGLLQC